MKYDVQFSTRFKKDYKRALKQGKDMSKLQSIIRQLTDDEALSEKHHNHELSGEYAGYCECHVQPDWLLIYRKIATL